MPGISKPAPAGDQADQGKVAFCVCVSTWHAANPEPLGLCFVQ